jgi:hypothetical protein
MLPLVTFMGLATLLLHEGSPKFGALSLSLSPTRIVMIFSSVSEGPKLQGVVLMLA